jgi:hypothetical protein
MIKPTHFALVALPFAIALACGGDDEGGTNTPATGGSSNNTGGSATDTGGSAGTGTGGTTTVTDLCDGLGTVGAGTDGLIDDLEDEDNLISETDERAGSWYASGGPGCVLGHEGDLMPTAVPENEINKSGFAMNLSAADCSPPPDGYGASLGLNLNSASGPSCGYDVSAYDGVYFWATGTPDRSVNFSVLTTQNIPPEMGGDGTCIDNCWNGYSKSIKLTADWTLYSFTWNQLKQGFGWGARVNFDPAKVAQMSWSIGTDAGEIWVDQVGFYKGDAAPADPPAAPATP